MSPCLCKGIELEVERTEKDWKAVAAEKEDNLGLRVTSLHVTSYFQKKMADCGQIKYTGMQKS